MYLSQKQIDDYQNYGAIIIKDAFIDWIKPLRDGFQKVLDNPSQHGRENVNENEWKREDIDLDRIWSRKLRKMKTLRVARVRSRLI